MSHGNPLPQHPGTIKEGYSGLISHTYLRTREIEVAGAGSEEGVAYNINTVGNIL